MLWRLTIHSRLPVPGGTCLTGTPLNSGVMCRRKVMLWRLAVTAALILFFVFLLPPYSIQAYTYWYLNKEEFRGQDSAFKASGESERKIGSLSVRPNYRLPEQGRLYFIGSVFRFGRQYDVSYISGGRKHAKCYPIRIYTERPLICDLPLSEGWSIHYESAL